MIEWVFLDVGNALLNDDPQNFHAYRIVHEAIRAAHPGYTFEAMLAERESMASEGLNWVLHRIAQRYFDPDQTAELFVVVRAALQDQYDENNVVNDGALELLEELRSHRRLGIIANQSLECRPSLARRGLLSYFDVVAISDELNLYKPDVRLYEWALAQAACAPSNAVMIGDRRDNDMVPAHALGMRTILMRWPSCRSKGWNPPDATAQAFLDSCDRVPLFSAVPVGPEPDRTVGSLPSIVAAVRSLDC